MYQEVIVKFRRGVYHDIEYKTADNFYFIETTKVCAADRTACDRKECVIPTDNGVKLWSVNKDTNGNTAEATVIIKSTVFEIDKNYKICYIKKGGETAGGTSPKVREVRYTYASDFSALFTVKSSIYTTPVMTPSTVYAGQGPVTLTITVATDRAINNKQVTQPAYLIPCTAQACLNEGDGSSFTKEDKNKMASLCSRIRNQDTITTGAVTGFGSVTLKTTFTAPLTPAAFYRVCVPYCFKPGDCDNSAVSWVLVDSDTPIKFKEANPSSYTFSANTLDTLTFTGTNIKAGDKIRILAQGQVARGGLCPVSSDSIPNSYYSHEVTATTPPSGSEAISFPIPAGYADVATGQVCYSSADTSTLWTPVFQSPKQTALYFSLENADVPTLYQEVRVKVRRGPTAATHKFTATDKFETTDEYYFIDTSEGKQCVVPPEDKTLWSVKEVGTDGDNAVVTVIIKQPEFTVGKTYKMCYIKKDSATTGGIAYEASSTLMGVGTPVSFTVLSSIYTAHMTDPATVYAGQGPVTLTITKPLGASFGNKEIEQSPYLIPCPNGECSNKDNIAALCSKGSVDNLGAITTGAVTGFGTDTLRTTFTAPVTAAASYRVCVPYCFKPESCEGSKVSWSLVDSNNPITLRPTNPSSYLYKHGRPLTFTGTGLQNGDRIRILPQGELCSASPTVKSQKKDDVTRNALQGTQAQYLNSPLLLHYPLSFKGQVCYSRADTPTVWAPVSEATKKAALYFSLENSDAPTIYQEVLVKVRRGSAVDNPQFVFETKDMVYFEYAAAGTAGRSCNTNPSSGVTLWSVKEVGTDGAYAVVSVIIKQTEFTVGRKYKMCYIKKDPEVSCDEAYEASASTFTNGKESPAQFTVKSSIYTKYEMTPTTVYAGQGPVTLTVDTRRAKGNTGMSQRPYLIPCKVDECPNYIFSEVDKYKMAKLCSKGSAGNSGAITTGDVTGLGTGTLKTTFFAPLTSTDSYGVCVPYCFNPESCKGSAVSWALVNSDTPITFEPSNPLYTIDPNNPHTLTFTGNGLEKGDKIRILTAGQGELCPISGTLLPNVEYTEVTVSSSTRSFSKLTISTAFDHAVTGQVCYSRVGSPKVWAPVFQSAGKTVSDLIIRPIEPTAFRVVTATPEIGKDLDLTFTGTGLGARDSSYLVPCASETSNPQQSTDYCDDKEKKSHYTCPIIKVDQSVKCTALINAPDTNTEEMRLCVCYRKADESKYAPVKGSVVVQPKPKTPPMIPKKEDDPPKTDKDEDALVKKPVIPEGPKQDSNSEEIGRKEPKPAEKPVTHNTEKDINKVPNPKKPGQTTTDGKDTVNDGNKNKDDNAKEPKQDGKTEKKDKAAEATVTLKPATVPKLPKADPPVVQKPDVPTDNDSKSPTGAKVPLTSGVTVPPMHEVNKTTTLSATAISSTIPAVLITSVVFLYLYNW